MFVCVCVLTGQGIGLILVGLVVRLTVSFIVVLGNRFRWSELAFVAIAWLPKATVQVRVGIGRKEGGKGQVRGLGLILSFWMEELAVFVCFSPLFSSFSP